MSSYKSAYLCEVTQICAFIASTTLTILSIQPPTIVSYPQKLSASQSFQVAGTTYPDAVVTLDLTDANNAANEQSVTADASGNFSLDWTGTLVPGTYTFTVTAKDTSGATSLPTSPRTFIVTGSPFAAWGSTIMSYLLLAFAIIAGLALVLGTGYILWYRLGRLRRRLKKMTIHSGRNAQRDFERIMDDLHALAVLLHRARQNRKLTEEEETVLETLKRDLMKMEEDVLSRLEQIDDEAER